MGKLTNFADEVNEDLGDLEQLFSGLYDKKQLLKQRGAEVAGRWSEYFADQTRALAAAENAINRLSNVPLAGTSGTINPKVTPPAGDAGGAGAPTTQSS